jgi:putative endonuclease
MRGEEAEAKAALLLMDLGYTIITRNFYIRGGEIDLVAMDGEMIVFVEVRMRLDGTGANTISTKKRDSLTKTARAYMSEVDSTRDFRFDLVTIADDGVRHHPNFLT